MTEEQREKVKRILGELAGAASTCWEQLERAGVFKSDKAIEFVDDAFSQLSAVLEPLGPMCDHGRYECRCVDCGAPPLGATAR